MEKNLVKIPSHLNSNCPITIVMHKYIATLVWSYVAVVVRVAPVRLGSPATFFCIVDPNRLPDRRSLSLLEYQWTVGGNVMQQRSRSNEFYITVTEVNDARSDYGCDVFAPGQRDTLFDRALGSLQLNSKLSDLYFCCAIYWKYF